MGKGSADTLVIHSVYSDIPVTGSGHFNSRRKTIKSPTKIGMTPAIFITTEVTIIHKTDIAGGGTLNNHSVIFV